MLMCVFECGVVQGTGNRMIALRLVIAVQMAGNTHG